MEQPSETGNVPSFFEVCYLEAVVAELQGQPKNLEKLSLSLSPLYLNSRCQVLENGYAPNRSPTGSLAERLKWLMCHIPPQAWLRIPVKAKDDGNKQETMRKLLQSLERHNHGENGLSLDLSKPDELKILEVVRFLAFVAARLHFTPFMADYFWEGLLALSEALHKHSQFRHQLWIRLPTIGPRTVVGHPRAQEADPSHDSDSASIMSTASTAFTSTMPIASKVSSVSTLVRSKDDCSFCFLFCFPCLFCRSGRDAEDEVPRMNAEAIN